MDHETQGLRAERTARELARINKKLTIVLWIVALPYVLAAVAFVLALAGGTVEITGD